MVDKFGMRCERCPWYKFCHGCKLECNDDVFSNPCSYLAIDWDSTVLHLRYQYPLERVGVAGACLLLICVGGCGSGCVDLAVLVGVAGVCLLHM